MRFIFFLLIVSSLILSSEDIHAKSTLIIRNQQNFDELQNRILSLIESGENSIIISFSPGQYVAKNNHLNLNNISAPNSIIRIKGNGAKIIPLGRSYKNGDRYEGVFSVDNCWIANEEDLSFWSSIRFADGLVEVINETEKRCRIKTKETIKDEFDCDNAYILIPHWYVSSTYRIERIEGGYIYFVARDLAHSSLNKGGYNINDDFYFRQRMPRYMLCNVEIGEDLPRIINGIITLPSSIKEVYEGRTVSFISVRNSSFRKLDITGLNIYGNSKNGNNYFITFNSLESESVNIQNCLFEGLRGPGISIYNTSNVTITDNSFRNCYSYAIRSENKSTNTSITNNRFFSIGLGMQNTFAISCHGSNYTIINNFMQNYGYGGIEVGVWYRANQTDSCYGVIEKNQLCFTPQYYTAIADAGIMDGGAIYLSTKNDGAIIRYNYINGFSGAGGNRGIFCDDGAYGFQIYGNVIINIDRDDYCIASRRDGRLEKQEGDNRLAVSNTNNIIRNNIIDGSILFVGNECENNGCECGPNYYLLKKGQNKPLNTISNVTMVVNDIDLDYYGKESGKIGLSRNSIKLLKNDAIWKRMKKFIVRKQDRF